MQFPWPRVDFARLLSPACETLAQVWPSVRARATLCLVLTTSIALADGGDTNRLALQVEALKRLKGMDFESKPALKAAVMNVLQATRGTPQFVELVRELKIQGQAPDLLEYAITHPADATGVEALRMVLAEGETGLVKNALRAPEPGGVVQALGNAGGKEAATLLLPLVTDPPRDGKRALSAVRALAQTSEGAGRLLDLVGKGGLPDDLNSVAVFELRRAPWPDIKAKVATLLPPTRSAEAAPLPPIATLAQRKGDPSKGAEVFRREQVGCIRCHQINGNGTDFGPNLSEIGTKLAKEALYEAILDPSAGISFGFEAWEVELKNGDEAYGLVASETADELAIKTQNGIVSRYRKADIARRVQQKVSIMPSGLAATMSEQDLVDLVEYLASLKKRGDTQSASAERQP